MSALLDAGAEVDSPGRKGRTPVMFAAMGGQVDMLDVLLAKGADAGLGAETSGNTALMLAANRGRLTVMQRLLGAGADVNVKAKDGWTALQAAEMIGDDEAVALLRDAGARE